MKHRLRIGTVPYLNALPLVSNLNRFLPDAEIAAEVPAHLEQALQTGTIDVALISSIYLHFHPECSYVPGVTLSGDGPIDSVLLYRRTERQNIRTIALDPDSLTSNTLIRILFEQEYQLTPHYVFAQPEIDRSLEKADAVVRIGYLRSGSTKSVAIDDLGMLWKEATGLPFVYALWIIRAGLKLSTEQEKAFADLRDYNLQHLDTLLPNAPAVQTWGIATCRHYLTKRVLYTPPPNHDIALNTFIEKAGNLNPSRIEISGTK